MVKWSPKTRVTGMNIDDLLDIYENDNEYIEQIEYAHESVYNEMEED